MPLIVFRWVVSLCMLVLRWFSGEFLSAKSYLHVFRSFLCWAGPTVHTLKEWRTPISWFCFSGAFCILGRTQITRPFGNYFVYFSRFLKHVLVYL